MSSKGLRAWALTLAVAVVTAAPLGAQQGGRVTGPAVDQETGRPLVVHMRSESDYLLAGRRLGRSIQRSTSNRPSVTPHRCYEPARCAASVHRKPAFGKPMCCWFRVAIR